MSESVEQSQENKIDRNAVIAHRVRMERKMETRVAVIAIIIEDGNAAQEVNELLHGAANYIIGRMGIPYRDKGISIISIAIDAPQDVISTLSGKIGRLKGVSVKTAYSNVVSKENGAV